MLVDSDVLIRFFTGDDRGKARRFLKFLSSGERVTLTDVTFAEVYWTLRRFYNFSRQRAVEVMRPLLGHKAVFCNDNVLAKTFEILEAANVSFVDAYLSAYSSLIGDSRVLSFDKDFDKIKGIKRIEP